MKLITIKIIGLFLLIEILNLQHLNGQEVNDYFLFQNDEDSDDNETTTQDPFLANCKELELKIHKEGIKKFQLSTCCKVPEFFVFEQDYINCNDECDKNDNNNPNYIGCCNLVCYLTSNGFLTFSTDPNLKPELNLEGIIRGLKASEFYDESWEPIIELSTRRCYEDCYGLRESYGYFCDVIPRMFGPIEICSKKENFLKCPSQHWNPKKLEKCNIVRQYMEECFQFYKEDFDKDYDY